MADWLVKNRRADTAQIARELGVSETVARLLINRGVRSYEEARAFLKAELAALCSPFDIAGVDKAARRLFRHIEKGSKIAVYSDYDVDGVMSAVILMKCLAALGADCVDYVPDREKEGYGLNENSVISLKEDGVKLIITCDNGITALEEARLAYESGMEVIVIDHHEPLYDEKGLDILPESEAIINPKTKLCNYKFKQMCAAGLCYRFALALFELKGIPVAMHDDLLAFAAIATVCDIVDLLEDNRIIVKNGLEAIARTNNIGLRALLDTYELNKVTTYHLGFILGPAINASGRLESASTAVRLFLTDDKTEANEIAQKLKELNISRRAMTEETYTRLSAEIASDNVNEQKVYVLYDKSTHESVAGIAAGKLKEKFNHPTIIIADAKGCAKGSARSIHAYNIFQALSQVSGLLLKFGGHSQAAGFSIKPENIDALRTELNERCRLEEADFRPKLSIDMRLPLNMITFGTCEELAALEPFGKGNPEPVFAEKNVAFKRIEFIGKEKRIVKLWHKDYPFTSIIFDNYDKFVKLACERTGASDVYRLQALNLLVMDIAFCATLNEFRGESYIQLVLKDFR